MAYEQIHKKKAQEQDGKNDPWRAPQNFAFYNGEDDFDSNGGEPIETPRVPGQPTNQPTVFGKKNCKANSGSFGDIRQQRAGKGVTMKVRYELNVNTGAPYERTSLYNEILPNLEDATTTMLLPAFFSDECMKISITGSSSRRKRGRYLRGGGDVEENEDLDILFNEMEEQDSSFGYQHQHRRLNRVIGIDSDPMDFPLNGEGKDRIHDIFHYLFSVPLSNPTSFALPFVFTRSLLREVCTPKSYHSPQVLRHGRSLDCLLSREL
jgi:hypothetical protein